MPGEARAVILYLKVYFGRAAIENERNGDIAGVPLNIAERLFRDTVKNAA